MATATDSDGCPMPVCTSCPEYAAPSCADDETLATGTDSDGCPMPVCTSCPMVDISCDEGDFVVMTSDADGCQAPTCEPCPEYAMAACADNETLVDGVDADGCPMPKCIVCPEYAEPSCESGERLNMTADAEGCPMPVCATCPIYAEPTCPVGESLVWNTDSQGCSAPECNTCPEYGGPQCLEGQEIIYTDDENGCPMPICDPTTPGCFSPTQNLDTAYDGGVGCACSEGAHDRCVSGAALTCQDDHWTAVVDGPCMPSICNEPLDIDDSCERAEWVGYWHNAATGQCEPFMGGCPRGSNAFDTFEECASTCQDKVTTAAVVPWNGCFELGEQISAAGDESTYQRTWNVITKEFSWGCGCPERPEFVITYELASPLRLRLCHDDMADSCEANCTMPISFDLGQALEEAGTTQFVFVD